MGKEDKRNKFVPFSIWAPRKPMPDSDMEKRFKAIESRIFKLETRGQDE